MAVDHYTRRRLRREDALIAIRERVSFLERRLGQERGKNKRLQKRLDHERDRWREQRSELEAELEKVRRKVLELQAARVAADRRRSS